MEFRIPVVNQSTLFEDINRKALVRGKLEVLDPVSNTPLDIWSFSDEEYVPLENPVILDIEGRVPQTIFCDRIVYVRVYAYKGDDLEGQPIYEFIRDFYAGENMNSEVRDYAIGINDLRGLDPEVNTQVNVLGYHTAYDCPMRSYMWDPNSTLDPDGGYVIGSNVTATGRWILLFDGEYIPSSYYGVYPGQEANMNALLGYVAVIKGKSTAPGIWFVPGSYSTATAIYTNKKVMVDRSTYFAASVFGCNSVTVVGTTDSSILYPQGIVDFYVNDKNCTVHSSWYKTITGFFGSGADNLVYDSVNSSLTQSLSGETLIENKTITFNAKLSLTYAAGAYLHFKNCNLIGNGFLSPSNDYVKFTSMDIMQRWWANVNMSNWSVGTINNGQRIEALSAAMNTVSLNNFENAAIWLLFQEAYSVSTVDLQGRYAASYIGKNIYTFKNGHIGTLHFTLGGSRELINMTVDGLTALDHITLRNSIVTFDSEYTGGYLAAHNSTIGSTNNFNCDTNTITLENCELWTGIVINAYTSTGYSDSAYSKSKNIYINNSKINGSITSKGEVYIYDSEVQQPITIYPHISGSNKILRFNFCGNVVTGSGKLTCTVRDFSKDGSNVSNVRQYIRMLNNSWVQDDSWGFDMPLFVNFTTPSYFLCTVGLDSGYFIYQGNTGKCPVESIPAASISNGPVYLHVVSSCYYYVSTAENVFWLHTDSTQSYYYPTTWDGNSNMVSKRPITFSTSEGKQSVSVFNNNTLTGLYAAWVPIALSSWSENDNHQFRQICVASSGHSAPGFVDWR